MLSVVTDEQARAELATDEGGHRLVVGNGHAPARTLTTAAGPVEVVGPRIDDRRVDPDSGQRVQFQSVLLPRWCRRSPKVAAVPPLLYLHGLSSMDFVAALEGFFGATAEQRCWVHKVRNVLGALPNSVHADARRALNEIIGGEDRAHAERAIQALVSDDGAKWPKAVAKVTDDAEALVCFFDDPAEHWLRLRTTNPIERSFSPVRASTRLTEGPGNNDAGLAMVVKLLDRAEPDHQRQEAAA